MSNIAQFPKAEKAAEFTTPQAEGVGASILKLFELLPLPDQQALVEKLRTHAQLIPGSRSKEVLRAVVHFLPQREEWTAKEIKDRLAQSGVEADSRAVFNAIGYLVRKNRVQRLGGGRYRVGHVVIETADNLGGEPPRYHYDD